MKVMQAERVFGGAPGREPSHSDAAQTQQQMQPERTPLEEKP